jgi:hypothetical protein
VTLPDARYRIEVVNPEGVERGVRRVELDGAALPDGRVPVLADGGDHVVRVEMGAA